MGSLVSSIGGLFGDDPQQQAAQTAANSQDKANQQNYQMFQESRGANGSAVLPLYLKNSNGSLFEGSLGTDLVNTYNQSNTPLSTFQSATSQLQPAQANANTLTNNIFNGGVTKEMQSNAAPVQQSRLATARSSSLDALHSTLDSIDATQASRGYVGDSYGNRLLSFQAGKSAGNAIGAADQQNKQETADISNYGNITLPMNNLTLPYSMAQQNNNMAFLPQAEWLQSLNQRMAPLNMVKIGAGAPFQYQPLPTAGPGAYSGMSNFLTAAGNAATAAYGNNQQNRLMQSYMNQMGNNGYVSPAQSNAVLNEFYNGSSFDNGSALAGANAAAGMSGGSVGADAYTGAGAGSTTGGAAIADAFL